MSKTLGQDRIGDFNPSGEGVIDGIKQRAADLIDYIDANVTGELNPEKVSDIMRLKAIAVTSIEKASMDGVKAYIHYKK